VNRDPQPGPTEATLLAAAAAEAVRRDAAAILADTSIIPPALWRDHPDAEVRAFYTGERLNPRSVAYADGLLRPADLTPDRPRPPGS
jgi:hypothetical protein